MVGINIDKIQFKQVVGYTHGLDNLLKQIRERELLAPGEPMVCSYIENDEEK